MQGIGPVDRQGKASSQQVDWARKAVTLGVQNHRETLMRPKWPTAERFVSTLLLNLIISSGSISIYILGVCCCPSNLLGSSRRPQLQLVQWTTAERFVSTLLLNLWNYLQFSVYIWKFRCCPTDFFSCSSRWSQLQLVQWKWSAAWCLDLFHLEGRSVYCQYLASCCQPADCSGSPWILTVARTMD